MESVAKNFLVYKSSAGSGKTHTLVLEYLTLLLSQSDRFYFKHILAITFTNKAVHEMKTRILNSLEHLSGLHGELDSLNNSMLGELAIRCGVEEKVIQERAEDRLEAILHNYSSFSVKTIDQFTYDLVRVFALDLGYPMGFEANLDLDTLADELVLRALERSEKDEVIRSALLEMARANMNRGRNWAVSYELKKVAKDVFSDHQSFYLKEFKKLSISDFLKVRQDWTETVKQSEAQLQKIGESVFSKMQAEGLEVDSFTRKGSGIGAYFEKLSKGEVSFPNSYQRAAIEEGKLFTRSSGFSEEDYPELLDIISRDGQRARDIAALIQTYQALLKTFFTLALFQSFRSFTKEIHEETGQIHISEFNRELKELIRGEPAPYIYERLGVHFKHFLIDEFQDTSFLQWRNLLPLFSESLSYGHRNIVVGDAKQSIYRFRGGLLEQLVELPKLYPPAESASEELIEKQLETAIEVEVKDTNYRSAKHIVEFNSQLFSAIRSHLSEAGQKVYENVEQKTGATTPVDGYVELRIPQIDKEDDKELDQGEYVTDVVRRCLRDGYKCSDIAILVRGGKQASYLANHLMEEFPVVSPDSLKLTNAPAVRLLALLLRAQAKKYSPLLRASIVVELSALDKLSIPLTEALKSARETKDSLVRWVSFITGMSGTVVPETYSALESAYTWCHQLSILPEEDYYVCAFLDFVQEHQSRDFVTCGEFAEYWDKVSDATSIPLNDDMGIEGVKILTAHKSKGLAFPVVIAPFIQEDKVMGMDLPKAWVSVEQLGLDFTHYYLEMSKSGLENTPFFPQYEEEDRRRILDYINLIYVICTRPRHRLYLSLLSGTKNKPIQHPFEPVVEMEGFDSSDMVYRRGAEQVLPAKEKAEASNQFLSRDNTGREYDFKTAILKARLAVGVEDPDKERNIGLAVHGILSRVETTAQYPEAKRRFLERSDLSSSDGEVVSDWLDSAMEEKDIIELFDHAEEVLLESEWKSSTGEIKRPDRVQFETDGTATIIDFKTGHHDASHNKQMLEYREALNASNQKVSRMVLVYFNPLALVDVS